MIADDWGLHLVLNMIEREWQEADWDGFVKRTKELQRQRTCSTILTADLRSYKEAEDDIPRSEAMSRYMRAVKRHRRTHPKP